MRHAPKKAAEHTVGLPKNFTEFCWDIVQGWSFGLRISLPFCFGRKTLDRQFAGSLWVAPLIGLVLCLLSVGPGFIFWLLTNSWMLASFLILSGMLFFSGSLHEDGLADVADAAGVIGDDSLAQQKRLEVMKDPRLGVFGVQALLLSLGFRFFGMVSACAAVGFGGMVLGFLAMVPSTRVLMVWLLYLLPSVRRGGIADRAGTPGYGVVIIATILGLMPLVLVFGWWALWAVLVLAACFGVWFFITRRMFGGVTGDSCGAVVIIGEVVLWLWFSVLVHLRSFQSSEDFGGFISWPSFVF